MKKRFNVKDKRVVIRKLDANKNKPVKYIKESDVKVTILNDIPNMDYLPELVMATWNEDINEFNASLTEEDRKRFIFRTLQGKFIPTALRSIPITFKIENMSWHDVSHLIRHTQLSYASDCSGDKVIENRPIILPQAVTDCDCFEEYDEAMRLLNYCYDKILNDGGHIQDARLMLPRTMTTFYYVTGNLHGVIDFIKARIDRQVQPRSDNLIAMKLLLELCKKIPELYFIVNPEMPNSFYIRETTTNFASKWQPPLPQNAEALKDCDTEFLYDSRDNLPGNSEFVEVWNELLKTFETRKNEYAEENPEILKIVEDCTTGDWR